MRLGFADVLDADDWGIDIFAPASATPNVNHLYILIVDLGLQQQQDQQMGRHIQNHHYSANGIDLLYQSHFQQPILNYQLCFKYYKNVYKLLK